MRIDGVSTSRIGVRQVQWLRDLIYDKNNIGNTCLSLQVYYIYTPFLINTTTLETQYKTTYTKYNIK